MADDKELFDLGGGIGVDSADLTGTMGLYLVTPEGSRFVTLDELKTWVNTDPTVIPASEPFRGANVQLSSGTVVANTSVNTLSWGSARYDTDSFWSGGSPTRLTVPSGVDRVRVNAGFRSTGGAAVGISCFIVKNGSVFMAMFSANSGFANGGGYCSTGVIDVDAGDYFELQYVQGTATSRTVEATDRTFFSIEAVEHSL